MVEDIVVNFVIPKECTDENSCSQDMLQAFLTCEQHRGGGLHPKWVHEKDCGDVVGLTRKDVFVLSEFEGPLFDKLKTSKCLLVGPRCLSCCLTEGIPIPSGAEPMFTVAMRGLVVTASGFNKCKKDNIKRKVQWMGGTYSVTLLEDTTHLVSDTVLSDKYIKSVEKGIPIMSDSWIQDVWESSLQLNVNGASEQFSRHLLPPFANLEVTTSGIGKKEKQNIINMVNKHGGTFSGAFQSETTDVVVLNRDGMNGDKYKAAVEYNKICVLPKWIFDSVEKGVALPSKKYSLIGAITSSPLTQHKVPDMSLNISRITNVRPANNYVDETRNNDLSTLSCRTKLSQESRLVNDCSVSREIVAAFENLDMNEIKKAGPILDGYCFLVCGPAGNWRDRACNSIVRAGGVRLECDHPRLTHVLTTGYSYVRNMTLNVPILSPMWLIDTFKNGRPVDEREYIMDENTRPEPKSARKDKIELASPMSKRNLQLLRPPQTPVTPKKQNPPIDEAPEDLLHYLSQNPQPSQEKTPDKRPVSKYSVQKPDDTDCTEDVTEDIEQIFEGISIEVQDLEEDALSSVSAEVSAVGGVMVRTGGQYCVVPLDFNTEFLRNKNAESITVFWIKDCITQQEVVPIEYYHRPVSISDRASKALTGVVLSLSTYVGMERAFLDELAKLLGAITQLRFCRRTTSTALASTHLLCPTPTGDKYEGAVKWGLPAVTGQWVVDSAIRGQRQYEGPYLVGNTKAPPPLSTIINDVQDKSKIEEQTKIVSSSEVGVKKNRSLPDNNSNSTPKGKQGHEDDMSPASRYIAMAKQGLLEGYSQETPKRVNDLQKSATANESSVRTPVQENALSTPNLLLLSPNTRRRMIALKKGEMSAQSVVTPTDPFCKGPQTPDSGFGAALRPGSGRLSPQSRKRLWTVVQSLPEKQHVKDAVTPLSEVKNRFLAQFNNDSPLQVDLNLAPRKLNLHETPPIKKARISEIQNSTDQPKENVPVDGASTSSLPASVDAQLQQLCATLNSRTSSPAQRLRRQKELLLHPVSHVAETESMIGSQPNTVGWDDSTGSPIEKTSVKRFIVSSNVENHEEIISMIQSLGGEISNSGESDAISEVSHLLSAAVGRSERLLVCLAAGKWVLHPSYILQSHKAGRFLNEEEFEWGNALARCLPSLSSNERELADAVHRWRTATQRGENGPYHGVAAILHVLGEKRKMLAKLLKAGGGVFVDVMPPYSKEDLSDVTVCFADTRRCPFSESDAKLLRSLFIPVCPPVLLSNYLTDKVAPVPAEHCLPDFKV